MSQSPPHTCLLTEALNITNIPVGKFAEFFHHLLIFIRIFIRTNMNSWSSEYRFLPFEILFKKCIHKFIGLGVEQIQMVHAIFFTTNFWFIMSEGQCMGGSIYFRNNFNKTSFCLLLQVNKFLFRIISIPCSQTGESFRFQTESSVSLIPIMVEKLFETIIIQMNLQRIHFIISHNPNIILQSIQRNKFTPTINHKSPHFIIRIITDCSLRQVMVILLLCHLQQSTRSPIYSNRFRGRQRDTISNTDSISLFAQLLIFIQL